MPLYEYECQACHRRTEKILKYSDPELTVCPHCGGPLERTLTAPAVHFAGGGWYKDLYSSAKPAASGGEGAAAKSEGASSDASPAAGAATASPTAGPGAASGTATPASAPATAAPSAPAKGGA